MIRNLKALGLALVATAAFGPLAASGAQAAPTFSADTAGEWHPTGIPIGIGTATLAFGAETTCEEEHGDPTKTYTGAQTKIRGTPTASKCHAQIFGVKYPVTVTHNGCETEFHPTKKLEPTTYEGTAQLICPEGVKGVEIHTYQANDTKHEQAPRCTFTVKPQIVSGILTHNEPTDVKVTSNTARLNTTRTSGTLLQCGSESQTSEVHGDGTMTATNSEGVTVKATISGE